MTGFHETTRPNQRGIAVNNIDSAVHVAHLSIFSGRLDLDQKSVFDRE
jgi:hypothetical protein